MQIAGFIKTSLIEWPGKIVSVIFVPGCNFRCPFCHNADLVKSFKVSIRQLADQSFKEKTVLADLEKRKKWIDGVVLSVGSKEPVVVRLNGLLGYPKIEDLWSSDKKTFSNKKGEIIIERQPLKDIDCLTHNGFQPVSEIIRHKTKEVYRVICGPGNYEITVTGSHSVFVINQKGFFPKRVDELTKEDWLLCSRKIPSVQQFISKISILNYVDLLKINKEIREKKIAYWKRITSQIGRKTISELSREFGHSRKTIRDYYHLYQNGYQSLLDEWVIDDEFIRNKTSKVKVPRSLVLDSGLGELLGYAVAEGSARYEQNKKLITSYVFSLGDESRLAKKILSLYRKIFQSRTGTIIKRTNTKGHNQYIVIVGGRIIGEFISALVGRGFADKKIPDIIYNVSPDVQKAFIKALVEGGGHERIRVTRSQHEYSLKTASRKLAQDLIFLAKILSCFCWIERDKEYFRVVFSQNDLAKIVGEKKLSLKYSFRTRTEGIPRQLLGYSLRGQKRISREELFKWFNLNNCKRKAAAVKFGLMDENGKFTQKLEKMRFLYDLAEDWEIKEIRKIEKIDLKKKEDVYDLVVEQNHSFVAGTGMMLVHNTGGEPTLQEDLLKFLKILKSLKLLTMVHTNGSKPKVVEKLIKEKLVDYWAMDLKGDFENYPKYVGGVMGVGGVRETAKLIIRSGLPYEFRTTVVPGLHDQENLICLAGQIKKVIADFSPRPNKRKLKFATTNCFWYLQRFRPTNCLDKKYLKIKPFDKEQMNLFKEKISKITPFVELRGV